VFNKTPEKKQSQALKKLLEDRAEARPAGAKHIEVAVRLTPSNIKHLDELRRELERQGKGRFTRSELIRVAIALLNSGDF
jgi:hypothetical protein